MLPTLAKLMLFLVAGFVLHTTPAAQTTENIYVQTLDDKIYVLNPNRPASLTQIYDFETHPLQSFNVQFSDDAQRVAYVVERTDGWTLGVASTEDWQFNTTSFQPDAGTQSITLTWLPGDHLIATYLGREAVTDNIIIVGRARVTYQPNASVTLVRFPYECQHLMKVEGQLAFQCTPFAEASGQGLPLVQRFALQSDAMLSPYAPAEEIVRLDMLLGRPYLWLDDYGLVLFGSASNDLFGLQRIAPDGTIHQLANVGASRSTHFSLSPAGTRFLVQNFDDRQWGVYDMVNEVVLDTFTLGAGLFPRSEPGYVLLEAGQPWHTEDAFLYALRGEERNTSVLVLRTLAGEETRIPIPAIVFSINVVR